MSEPPLTPIRTGLFVVARDLADRRELLVAPPAGADVAGIDPILVERLRARRIAGEQQVAVVVKVADERSGHAGVEHPLLDFGDGLRGFRQVHRHADHLRPGLGQLDALSGRRRGIRRVGHGHRLDDDGRAATDLDGRLDADRPVNPNMPWITFRNDYTTARPAERLGRTISSGRASKGLRDWASLMIGLAGRAFVLHRLEHCRRWPGRVRPGAAGGEERD